MDTKDANKIKENVACQFGYLKDPEIDKDEAIYVLCNEIALQRKLVEMYRDGNDKHRETVFKMMMMLKDAWKNQAKPEQVRNVCDLLFGRFKGKYDAISDWLIEKLEVEAKK